MNYKILVNKDNLYDKNDFSNRVLKKVTNILNEEYLLEKRTWQAFLNLKKDLALENIYIDIVSGYRSVQEQQEIRESFMVKYGASYIQKYVAEPNTSEHHTGLCFDIGLIIDGKLVNDSDLLLKNEKIFKIIISKLSKYGLILRYPKDKESITKYNYVPWHYRYVGKKTALLISNKGLCLEEYDRLYNKSGIIIVNKPKGITSRDVVTFISDIFDTKKVGHNGTLDPLAEGVLVVTINKACKVNEILTCEDKEYIATVEIGVETDTLDIEGKVVRTSEKRVSKEDIEEMFKVFPSSYVQEVPKYAAVKINGKKLYEYARNNEDVELPKRKVEIKELELLEVFANYFKFRTLVSKGTYIRSLIKDMGEMLGIPCTMSELQRTKQGNFALDRALELKDITISSPLYSISEVLDIPKKEIKDEDFKLISNGATIDNNYKVKDLVLFLRKKEEVAIYKVNKKKLRCYKMLK